MVEAVEAVVLVQERLGGTQVVVVLGVQQVLTVPLVHGVMQVGLAAVISFPIHHRLVQLQ